jgi:rubrerythrin
MIRLTESEGKTSLIYVAGKPETQSGYSFECPMCNADITFYGKFSPLTCPSCQKRIVDISTLRDSEAARLRYHLGLQ